MLTMFPTTYHNHSFIEDTQNIRGKCSFAFDQGQSFPLKLNLRKKKKIRIQPIQLAFIFRVRDSHMYY
jgi:hypothetical protein